MVVNKSDICFVVNWIGHTSRLEVTYRMLLQSSFATVVALHEKFLPVISVVSGRGNEDLSSIVKNTESWPDVPDVLLSEHRGSVIV